MNRAWEISRTDLRLFFKDRGNLLGLLVIPVILTVVLGLFIPVGDGTGQVYIDVMDQDQSEASASLLDALRRSNSTIVLCPMDNDENDSCDLDGNNSIDPVRAEDRVADADTLAFIVIPAGYQEAVDRNQAFEIRYFADPEFSAPAFIQQAIQTALQEVNGSLDAAAFGLIALDGLPGIPADQALREQFRGRVQARAASLWAENPVRVRFQQTGSENVTVTSAPPGFSQSVPGMASMYVMGTVLGGMVALIGERKRWTLQRLVMMPIPGSTILGGKLSGRFILGMIQFVVVFAVGVVVGMNFGDAPLALILIMISYTLAMTAISFALGTYLTTEAQAGALAQLLVLTLAPLGGAWWPLEITPRALQIIGHISPVAWAMDGFHELFLRNGDLLTVLPEIGVLLAFT
ncbi:MAG: ABC transporter permease, partial [Anaerolineales bacterium]|nr:ABC transporter permease [Anaerolineales bacterium]